ncbi:NADPH-dependent F420 reductase [Streptomyces sp. NBC_00076]|uniref:NADPH-dependent F420 reductase n=1 Tax=Streptomyces sp. NBC_00076 TaxID=2975642 RepID=UPI003246C437
MSSISIIGLGNMARSSAATRPRPRNGRRARRRHCRDGRRRPGRDIVILAVSYADAAAVVSEYGDALHGKVIIDITNPVAPDLQGLVTPDGSSGAQEIAKAAPVGAHVVKAFNTLFSHVLAAGPAEGRPLDVFIAGDDAQAKARVSAFIESLGLRPMDTGELRMARALENIGLLELGLITHSVKHTDFSLGITLLS